MISNFRLIRFIRKHGISLNALTIGAGVMGLINLIIVIGVFNNV